MRKKDIRNKECVRCWFLYGRCVISLLDNGGDSHKYAKICGCYFLKLISDVIYLFFS